MKKITLTLIAFIYCITSFAQPGATCNNAIPETSNSTCTFTNYTTCCLEMWFSFMATSTDVSIVLENQAAFGTNAPHAHNITLFSGTCANLTQLEEDELVFLNPAAELTIDASGLIIGNTYYIRVQREATGAVECFQGACFPVIQNASFALCIQNIDVFIPLDFNLNNFGFLEKPISSHTYHTNKGQIVDTDGNPRLDIKSYTIGASPAVFITDTSVSYVYARVDTFPFTLDTMHRVDMKLTGGNPAARIFRTEKTPGHLNYYLGHIPTGITKMKGYSRAVCNNVYPNIDMQYYSNSNGLKYYFVVHPGGNADNIIMRFEGASSVDVTGSGGLRITTSLGIIEFEAGHAYQVNPSVPTTVNPMPWQAEFEKVSANEVKFDIRNYPKNKPLIIQVDRGHQLGAAEKVDDWSSYLGGTLSDRGNGVITDGNGNVYITGSTQSSNFPSTSGSLIQNTPTGGNDAFVIKYDFNGVPVMGTFYGGSGNDLGNDIALNSSGDIYFVGSTLSSDFPIVASIDSLGSSFIVRINNAGTIAKWSRHFGGNSSSDNIRGIAIDGNDNVYIVGLTQSGSGFPIISKPGAYNQINYAGAMDGFIAEFDSSNNQLWGSYFGGPSFDDFSTVIIGATNNILVSGSTQSTTPASSDPGNTPCDVPNPGYFPDCDPISVGGGYHQTSYAGGVSDIIIVEFDQNGKLIWSTYVGGLGEESSQLFKNSLAINPVDTNTIYLVFHTDQSTNLPIFGPGNSYVQDAPIFNTHKMAYIARFNFRFLNWGTLFGCGSGDITRGTDITVDNSGNVFITGSTRCSTPTDTNNYCIVPPIGEYPICIWDGIFFQDDGSGNPQFGGGIWDGYIAGFNSNNELILSSYYGGTHDDDCHSITYDSVFNRIYITGMTKSTSGFPLLDPQTGNYMQFTNAGTFNNLDAFIARFNVDTSAAPVSVNDIAGNNNILNIYPNPSKSEVYINLGSDKREQVEVRLYNTIGAVLRQETFKQNNLRFDLSGLAKGLYLLQVNADERTFTAKVIIQ